jgi:signal peptidase I
MATEPTAIAGVTSLTAPPEPAPAGAATRTAPAELVPTEAAPARARRLASRFAVAVALAVASVVLVPSILGYELYVITGGSMSGTVEPGTLVISRAVPTTDLAVGDVITYVPPPDTGLSRHITHRIVEIHPDADDTLVFRTKGDANDAVDPWEFHLDAPEQARMRTSVPMIGYPVLLLADRLIRMIAIGVPAAAIALLSARDLYLVLRRRRAVTEWQTAEVDAAELHVAGTHTIGGDVARPEPVSIDR